MFNRIFKAFEYPEFRVLWLGACTSSIGTWMQIVAQNWLVYDLTRSAWWLGLDAFLGQIPIFLFSLFGGVIADRRDRRKLLVVSQLMQMACAFTLAGLVASGLLQVWHILCLSFTVGLAQSFGGPAYQALVPSLVKPVDLPNAIALNSIQFNLARVIGPMLGGLALRHLGASWCFSLNGLSFLAVIFSLLTLKARALPAGNANTSYLRSIRESLAFVRDHGSMTPLIAIAFATTALSYPLIQFLPVFADQVLGGGSDTYTWLLCLSGAGSVAGALLVAAFGQTVRKGRAAVLLLIVLGLLGTLFARSSSLPVSGALLFAASAALIGVFSLVTSLVQLLTGDEMKGRVMSVYNVAFRGGMPIGALLAGEMISHSSASVVMAFNGLVLSAIGFYFLWFQRRLARL